MDWGQVEVEAMYTALMTWLVKDNLGREPEDNRMEAETLGRKGLLAKKDIK